MMPFHSQIAVLSMNVGAEQDFGTSCGLVPVLFDFEMAGPRSARFNDRLPCGAHGTSDFFLSTVQVSGGARGSRSDGLLAQLLLHSAAGFVVCRPAEHS